MNINNPEHKGASVGKNTSVRRTFLKRATAGAVIASIPGRSAWATVNGSVVASGQGSTVVVGACTQLLSQGYWKTHATSSEWGQVPLTETFFGAFGGLAFSSNSSKFTEDNSLLNILHGKNPDGSKNNTWKGPGDVNVQMIALYLAAANHGRKLSNQLIYYPVLADYNNKLNGSGSYGSYLYAQANNTTARDAFGLTLNTTIGTNHALDDGSLKTTC